MSHFSGRAYQVVAVPPAGNDCFERASAGQFSNFTLQVTVTFLQTHSRADGAGIIFRADGNPAYQNVKVWQQ